MLISLQAQHGNKWAHIARMLPGRTENAVKLRFNSLMQRGSMRKGLLANNESDTSSSKKNDSSSVSNSNAADQEAASTGVVPAVSSFASAFSSAARGLPFAAPVPSALSDVGVMNPTEDRAKRSAEDNNGSEFIIFV